MPSLLRKPTKFTRKKRNWRKVGPHHCFSYFCVFSSWSDCFLGSKGDFRTSCTNISHHAELLSHFHLEDHDSQKCLRFWIQTTLWSFDCFGLQASPSLCVFQSTIVSVTSLHLRLRQTSPSVTATLWKCKWARCVVNRSAIGLDTNFQQRHCPISGLKNARKFWLLQLTAEGGTCQVHRLQYQAKLDSLLSLQRPGCTHWWLHRSGGPHHSCWCY